MKKFLFIFGLIFMLSMNSTLADVQGKWFHPKAIRVYIQQGHNRTALMRHAFDSWSKITKYKLIFNKTITPNAADIDVFFVDKIDPNNSASDRAIGLTRTKTQSDKKIVHATIWIADYSQDGRKLTDDDVYTVMLHEIGHAIGLNHSKDPDSIMFPSENVKQEIAPEDLETLKKLYMW